MRSIHRARIAFLGCIAALLAGCGHGGEGPKTNPGMGNPDPIAMGAHVYRTAFSRTENPISEGGNWVDGGAAGASIWAGGKLWRGGRLWGNVQTSRGMAYGVDEPTEYGDPTAVLTGNWGPSQTVVATVRIVKTPTDHCCHELELRLRTTIYRYRIQGYEAYCSVMPDEPYCHIARWDGPNGKFWNFETGSSADYVKDGDVVKATVTGTNPTVITFYKNGKQILQATDSGRAGGGFQAFGPWISGNPGIGFYDTRDDDWRNFGFSSFSATDGDPAALASAPNSR